MASCQDEPGILSVAQGTALLGSHHPGLYLARRVGGPLEGVVRSTMEWSTSKTNMLGHRGQDLGPGMVLKTIDGALSGIISGKGIEQVRGHNRLLCLYSKVKAITDNTRKVTSEKT